MIFKLTHAQTKQLPWYICYFLVCIQFHVKGQNGEIKDCNVKDIITQLTVTSSNNQQLTLTNCTYIQGKLSDYLNCIKNNNPTLPATASLVVTITADPASGISVADLDLLKQEVLQKNIIANTCNRVGSDSDLNNKLNTIDLCLIRKHNLGLSNINPSWKFYKSQNLSLTGIGPSTNLIFPVKDFPLSKLNIIGIHNGNVNQVTTSIDTCVLLCKPDLRITPGKDEVRKLTTDYFLLNKSCNFPNLSLQILNTAGQNIGNDITQNMGGSQLTAQLRIDDTTQTCTTKLTVYPCETFVNIDVDQTNTMDSSFVDVIVRNAEFIAGYQISLKFDTSHLQFVKVEKGTESAFNVANDAHYNGKGQVNISRFKESSTLGLVNGTRLFRIKFRRKSTTIKNVIVDSENVETLFFDSNKNEYCTDVTYIKDINPPVCLQDTIILQGDKSVGYATIKFSDYASDDSGTVSFLSGVNEFDFPVNNTDTLPCGTNMLFFILFKDANGQQKQCTYRVIVTCPETCSNKFLYFDGVDDRINIPNQHVGNVEFTIECWFKSENTMDGGTADFHRIFTLGGSPRLEIGDRRGQIQIFNGNQFTIGPNIRDGLWHHLTLQRKNNKLGIFLDGNLINQSITSNTLDLRNIRVGYFDNNNIQPPTLWKGGIDEIKLWNYGLSQEEINNSKNKINTKKKDCGLIGYWRMEEGILGGNNQATTMIRDSVGTNNGILVGFNLTGNISNFVCNDSIQLLKDNSGCCDNKKPIFQNCPNGLLRYAGPNCSINVPFNSPVALDPCNNLEALVGCNRGDNKTLAESYPLGKTKITCIAIGSNSLRDTCTFDIEVRDTIRPICKGKTLNKIINTNGNASFAAIDLNDNSTDNCGNITFSASKTMFICNDVGKTNIVTLTVTDQSGNSSSCPVEVKLTDPNNYCACLNDVTKPVCKTKNISLFLDASGKANLFPAMINDGSFDACTDVTLQIEGPQSFDCNTLGKQTVNLVVTDVAKNVSFCTAEVTVLDTIKPTCNMQPKTFYLGTNGQITVTQNLLTITPIDNCLGATTTFTTINYTCNDIGTKNAVATVIDGAGNTNTCSTQITIRDTIRPTCSIPPRTIFLGTNGQASLTQAQLNITANDNCAGVIATFNTVNYNCNDIGIKNVMATVRDAAGNTNACASQITIRDTIRPICFIRDTVVTATDGTGVLVAFNGKATDNCVSPSITYSSPSGQMYKCGEYIIIMTARDGSGNTSTCPFKLTVKDCDGCCLSESSFMTITDVDFNLSSDLLNADSCLIQFITPKLTECQKVTEISWGDGTVSRGSFTNAVDFIHQYTEPAIYEVCVTYEEANQQNCFKNKKCNRFEVLDNCTLKRSTGQLDYNKIILVPNPAIGSFSVSGGAIFSDYAIYDQLGKEMVSKRKIENTNDISQLQNGVYFVKLFVGSIIVTKTIIKIQ